MNTVENGPAPALQPHPKPAAKSGGLGYPIIPPTPLDYSNKLGLSGPAANAKPNRESKVRPPQSLPKRPKGRFFIATVILLLVASLAHFISEGFVRYAAYGLVVGRRLEINPCSDGVIDSIHVREGDAVRAGDILFHVDAKPLQEQKHRLQEQLIMAQAQLSAAVAQLRLDALQQTDDRLLAGAEYYELTSQLQWHRAEREDLLQQLARVTRVHQENAVSEERLRSLQYQVAGKEQQIEQLAQSAKKQKQRVDSFTNKPNVGDDRISPILAEIQTLQSQLARCRQRLSHDTVRSPSNGRVVRISRFCGEYANVDDPVIELVVDGSTEVAIYLPQDQEFRWPVGEQVEVSIDPRDELLAGKITRHGIVMCEAPESIRRHYNAGQTLLPVFVRLDQSASNDLVLGSKVKLPRHRAMPHGGVLAKLASSLWSPFGNGGTDDRQRLASHLPKGIEKQSKPSSETRPRAPASVRN